MNDLYQEWCLCTCFFQFQMFCVNIKHGNHSSAFSLALFLHLQHCGLADMTWLCTSVNITERKSEVCEGGGYRAGVQRFRLRNSSWYYYYYWSRLPKSTQNKNENVGLGSLVHSSSGSALSFRSLWIPGTLGMRWEWTMNGFIKHEIKN